MHPVELSRLNENQLRIVWDDGSADEFQVRDLRLACRCAHCVDEWTREPTLDPDAVPADVHPLRIESVGRYALKFEWSDGHDTGIYTFEHLRRLAAKEKHPR